ncbi:MAG: hypothetical protein EPN84_05730 [Legionella sp.]|nr:MAG: hypothetical protein EPN84_05730 [Legionella sp.]
MKKLFIMCALLWSSLSLADSVINIPFPNGGLLEAKGGRIAMAAKGYIIQGVRYKVTCNIKTQSTIIAQLFASNGLVGISVNDVKIPGRGIVQVSLKPGDNKVVYRDIMDAGYEGDDHYSGFGFMNLDNTESAIVTKCSAEPLL